MDYQNLNQNYMPSYIRDEDYKQHLYQIYQDIYNGQMQNPMMGQPVQTQPMGAADNQPSQWSGQQ